jgi:hypothetical protein
VRIRSKIPWLIAASAAALLVTMAGIGAIATSAAAAPGYWLGGDDGGVFSFYAPSTAIW